jgi:subtilisin family serine protease
VRVLGCNGSGSGSGVIAGIDWVRNNHVKPAVANMSLGGGASTTEDNAVANAVNAGVVFAVAAGNDNQNACNYSPARAAAAITVGATTSSDARSSFSNWGTCVDLFAPGSSITSSSSSGGTATMSGTSMASPHVAGVAALYMQQFPSSSASAASSAIIAAATTGRVGNPGTGSPNRLLYSLFGGTTPTATPTNTPRPTATATNTPRVTPTATNTPRPGSTPTATATPTNTPRATPTSGGGNPAWAPNTFYSVAARVSYGGSNYECIQAHTSLTGWEPPNVPALWRGI